MIASKRTSAKIKFFAAYTGSVLLVLIIFASLYRGGSAAASAGNVGYPTSGDADYRNVNGFLQEKMLALDSLYALRLPGNKAAELTVESAETAMQFSLDSLDDVIAGIENREEQAAWRMLLSNYEKQWKDRSGLMKRYVLQQNQFLQAQNASGPKQILPVSNGVAMDSIRVVLLQKEAQIASLEKKQSSIAGEKDKTIASLQSQLQRQSVPLSSKSTAGEAEWKQKYTYIKSRHSELNSAYNALSQSYQAVVADNRRLLNHIQKTRNQ